jgi:hypothetical protein
VASTGNCVQIGHRFLPLVLGRLAASGFELAFDFAARVSLAGSWLV